MRTALLFQDGNFVGREYYAQLSARGRKPDLVAAVGRMSPQSVAREIARTGGLWNPPALPAEQTVHRFDSLRDPALWTLLREEGIALALQGGVGILTEAMLAVPSIGFLNVHPGRLPQYRGNMCPERAILNGDAVWATAHLIDGGIDTGPVVAAKRYVFDRKAGYHAFRANLYAHCAEVMAEAIALLESAPDPRRVAQAQPSEGAAYWPPLTDDEFAQMRQRFQG